MAVLANISLLLIRHHRKETLENLLASENLANITIPMKINRGLGTLTT